MRIIGFMSTFHFRAQTLKCQWPSVTVVEVGSCRSTRICLTWVWRRNGGRRNLTWWNYPSSTGNKIRMRYQRTDRTIHHIPWSYRNVQKLMYVQKSELKHSVYWKLIVNNNHWPPQTRAHGSRIIGEAVQSGHSSKRSEMKTDNSAKFCNSPKRPDVDIFHWTEPIASSKFFSGDACVHRYAVLATQPLSQSSCNREDTQFFVGRDEQHHELCSF